MAEVVQLNQEWHIGEELHSGGFGRVYLGCSTDGEEVVIKLVPKAPGAGREILFEDLDGVPNVIPILDRGAWQDFWVLVMPRAQKSLREYLGENIDQLSVEDTVQVLSDITQALVAIEGRIVHRDIKPDNILLLDGQWCLADFGISRYAEATTATDTRKFAMTPPYASPEQWRGDRASSATDVYALGVVAYELLAGRPPFRGPDYRHQHLEETPEPITGIPERIRSLVSECLYKGPQARPLPQNILTRLKVSMVTASPAAERLQRANAIAIDRQAEEARQESLAQVELERRLELRNSAEQSLGNTIALLHQQIMANASEVQISSRSALRVWSLNDATMRVDNFKTAQGQEDGHLPFDVIAYTTISIRMPADSHGYTGRSHSLWFCNAVELDVFRWYETAFMRISGEYQRDEAPFSMSPGGRDVALALSVLHTHQVAWPFTPIDQGDEEEFVERWIEWFAKAVQGELRYPSSMPEKNPQGSWRRGR